MGSAGAKTLGNWEWRGGRSLIRLARSLLPVAPGAPREGVFDSAAGFVVAPGFARRFQRGVDAFGFAFSLIP